MNPKVEKIVFSFAIAFGLLLVGLALMPGGSAGQPATSEGSRARLYASLDELALDSDAIVTGTVVSQEVVRDILPTHDFTLSQVEISSITKGTQIVNHEVITVRQHGSASQTPPAPLMEVGSDYLLFLVQSGLSGDLAAHFYVTGANAGLYRNNTDGTGFVQMAASEGENLPMTISREFLQTWVNDQVSPSE